MAKSKSSKSSKDHSSSRSKLKRHLRRLKRSLHSRRDKSTKSNSRKDIYAASGSSAGSSPPPSANQILSLLEPYHKDQLVSFLVDAIASDPSLLTRVYAVADSDVQHRKLFVHGFGWDASKEDMMTAFSPYGEVEDCNIVCDRSTGRCKGYGFITFRTRKAATLALKEPHKQIGNRMTTCQLAAVGPVPSGSSASNNPDTLARKIYVSNVHADTQPDKLRSLFEKFGEIELGPIGFDLKTGKSRGFALFVYKTLEGTRKALEEPYKMFGGRLLHCELASNSNNKKKTQSMPTMAPAAVAPPAMAQSVTASQIAAMAAAQNMALYSQNPYAAFLGQNPFFAAATLNPLAAVAAFNPAFAAAAFNPAAATGFATAAAAAHNPMLAKKEVPQGQSLLRSYQGSVLSSTQQSHGSTGGLSGRGFPGFMW
ncbi:UBP1-associated protein 2A-like protein [Carex littledalei]|uniref:UBP1-associated protein 2A-like protein n=1 Tax=Carex littledalei TaxID=544730 RepID=A0A833RDW9_9POAL|nr:UBP1-associated protein 2A-like protein [Carex littledalei]